MKKPQRLTISLILSLLSLGVVAPLAACQKEDNSFFLRKAQNPYGRYFVGRAVDIEDFIETDRPHEAKIKVWYLDHSNNKVEKELSSHVFYPEFSGEHHITYQIASKKLEFTINVERAKASLSFSDYPINYVVGNWLNFEDLLSLATPQVSPLGTKININEVYYRSIEPEVATKFGEASKVEFDKVEGEFRLEKRGVYEVKASAGEGKEAAEASIIVNVFDREEGNEKVLSSETGGKHLYNVFAGKGEKSNCFYIPAARYATASYVVFDHLFEPSETFSVTFKGNRAPNVGCNLTPNVDSISPFGPFSAKGYVFSFETNPEVGFVYRGPNCLNDGAQQASTWSGGTLFNNSDLSPNGFYRLSITPFNGSKNAGTAGLEVLVQEIENYGTSEAKPKTIYSHNCGYIDPNGCKGGYFSLYSSKSGDYAAEVSYGDSQVSANVKKYNCFVNAEKKTAYLPAVSFFEDEKGKCNVSREGYVAFTEDYGVGTKAAFAFHGKNIPNVSFFADKLGKSVGGGKGLFIAQGSLPGHAGETVIYGPERLDVGERKEGETYQKIGQGEALAKIPNSPFAYESLKDNQDYLYEVSVLETEANHVKIVLDLKDSSSKETISHKELNVSYGEPLNGKIMAYGQMGKEISFTYEVPNRI